MHPVPAAVEALVQLLRDAPALAGVRVEDGPPPNDLDERDSIGVGLLTEDVEVAASELRRRVGSTDEVFEVLCVAQCWSGDDLGWPPVRRRAYDLVDAVAAVLVAAPQLGVAGQVTVARLTRTAYRPERTSQGEAMAVVEFTVVVDAYRRHR